MPTAHSIGLYPLDETLHHITPPNYDGPLLLINTSEHHMTLNTGGAEVAILSYSAHTPTPMQRLVTSATMRDMALEVSHTIFHWWK
jgi:hypothetical protein